MATNYYTYLKILIYKIILVTLLISCKKDQNTQQNGQLTIKQIQVDGLSRRYAIYIPNNTNDKMPVIICLHGGGGSIEDITGLNGRKSPYKLWMKVADAEKLIIVYPEATKGYNNKNTWNDCRADCQICPNTNDVKFINTIIDIIAKEYNADTANLFICGVSNGGLMTFKLATYIPNKISAIATIIASLPDTSDCSPQQPSTPIPILLINGTDDPILPYQGGTINNDPDHGTVKPVKTTINFFTYLNKCDTTPDTYTFPDINTKDNSYVIKYSYKSAIGKNVIFYKVIGGGHAAPSIEEQYSIIWEQIVGKQNHDIETVYEIWQFFKNYLNN